ncbi:acetate kinase [Subtercola sp. PAMC28395]|uniref:acetate/propionate family kinase n=1 Tax=Subtercola sp. PAMC28395 TaxID=2846775 RepID=UPI001C0C6E11|nr:acetate kinase [Subtercola sp. PAMC28395]QWT24845.1 acetate kinase [Subtercola sp. PAMC28395]
MSAVLVINSGSSSLKYQLIEMATESVLASGLVERIGEKVASTKHEVSGESHKRDLPVATMTEAFTAMVAAFDAHGPSLTEFPPVVVGHRVVHGGKRFFGATIVNDLVKINIDDLAELAPLHNPANLQGIDAAELVFPGVPQVAVFDTAFHATLPAAAYTYAIDAEIAEKNRVRKYGFHGTSHKFVSEAAAEFLARPLSELKMIVLHLGNGASACAVDGGISVDTSMGLTPLEGLVMGTRSGDLDPAVLIYLNRKAGLGFAELDTLLNRSSGLRGMTGRGDMRDVVAAADAGDEAAIVGLSVYLHRLKHYVGAYLAGLGGADVIVFTAGVGENSPAVRAGALEGLEFLGIRIDPERNASPERGPRRISADDSAIAVLVVPTNEELEIARQALAAV